VATSNTVDATSEPSSDIVPPTAPSNLHLVRDDGCAEVWLGWIEATDETDAQADVEYEIYVNDVLSPLPVSAGVNLDFVYGTAAVLKDIRSRIDRSIETETVKFGRRRRDLFIDFRSGLQWSGEQSNQVVSLAVLNLPHILLICDVLSINATRNSVRSKRFVRACLKY